MNPDSFNMLLAEYRASRQIAPEKRHLPKKIQTMARAYKEICEGEDPWTALGNFANAWYGYATHMRAELVHEPLTRPEQETEYTHRWAAFCAASVDFLCERYGVPCPEWVNDPYYTLETLWWHTIQDTPEIRELLSKITPAPFARRNIRCTNRLFQTKYELLDWMLEAMDKGITDRDEIKKYMREREIAIHGG